MTTGSGRILVIRGGAIGDFILTLPVLSALRRQFPTARIEVLGYPGIASLARAGGLADAVRSIEARPLAGFFVPRGILEPDLMDYFAGCAVIVSYLYDPDGFFQANVVRCTKALYLTGPHRPDEAGSEPAAMAFLRPLERLAIFDAEATPRLDLAGVSLPPEDEREVALHPGSGSPRKNWDESRWLELLRRLLSETSRRVLLVGGEAEGERLERLATAVGSARVALARSLPLPDLARRLATARVLAGHDSGITHLTAALGRPVITLWGPSNLAIWRPSGPSTRVLQHADGLPGISVDAVWQTLSETLAGPDADVPART